MCGPFSDFYAFQMGLNYHIFILAFKKFAHHYENYFIMTNGSLFFKKKKKWGKGDCNYSLDEIMPIVFELF